LRMQRVQSMKVFKTKCGHFYRELSLGFTALTPRKEFATVYTQDMIETIKYHRPNWGSDSDGKWVDTISKLN